MKGTKYMSGRGWVYDNIEKIFLLKIQKNIPIYQNSGRKGDWDLRSVYSKSGTDKICKKVGVTVLSLSGRGYMESQLISLSEETMQPQLMCCALSNPLSSQFQTEVRRASAGSESDLGRYDTDPLCGSLVWYVTLVEQVLYRRHRPENFRYNTV